MVSQYLAGIAPPVSYTRQGRAQLVPLVLLAGMCRSAAGGSPWGWREEKQKKKNQQESDLCPHGVKMTPLLW